MKVKMMAITIAALMGLVVRSVIASDAVGYNRITVPANSDVRLSVPFNQDIVGTFNVNGIVAGSGVTVTDPLTPGAFANTYYVRFISGNGTGLWSTISNNGASDFVFVDLNVLNFINVGDKFRVYKHQTLSSVFPTSLLGISYVSGSQVLIYDNNIAAMTTNKSAAKVAAFTSAGGGHWVGSGVNDNTILKPETQFILRNNSGSTLTMITRGHVPDYSVSTLIAPNGDLVIGSGYPLPVVLKNAGLNAALRQVLFYDNSATGINKSAVKVAVFSGSNWVGAGVTGNELINPSSSITFRLPTSEAGTKVTINKPY